MKDKLDGYFEYERKREMLLETAGLADRETALLEGRLSQEALAELERQEGILGLTDQTRKSVAKSLSSIVYGGFHSATFSQRIWANQESLRGNLEKGLTRSILQGYNPKEWSRNLRGFVREEMGDTGRENSLYAANRIAVTETARVQTRVALESYRRGGFKQGIWIAEPTACPICAPFDDEVFDIDSAHPIPPMHPFCRCSIATYYDRSELDSSRGFWV